MFKRTLETMELDEASRVILPLGGAHKYALDEPFGDISGLRVLQLDDFLTTPLNLSESERQAFLEQCDKSWKSTVNCYGFIRNAF